MKKIITLKSLEQTPVTIEYELIRSKRKTYSIAIEEDGSVSVRVPLYVHDKDVEDILQKKQAWILQKLDLHKKRQADKPANNYTSAQKAALEKRYRDAAKQYFPKRVEYYFSAYPDIITGSYSSISIRNQKTRWGSCSSKGGLNFNWRLMLAPPNVLDYVVVHELCHLTHMNHSKEFWDCVSSILPDYKVLRKWLKDHGNELTLS